MTLRIGIDLGGTKTEGVVLNADGQELCRQRVSTPQQQGYDAIITAIVDLVKQLEQQTGPGASVGVGTPGAISTVTGAMKNCNTTCLNQRFLLQDLQQKLAPRPVRIANDANCFAISEAIDGAGADAQVVFGVIMGTGVGGGVVINKQLYPGRQHIAGEWGHNPLDADGPACYCGRRGCVETLISGPGLAAAYQRLTGQTLTARKVMARAAQGEAAAEQVVQQFYHYFAQALAMVINILDPDVIVLGGGLSNHQGLYQQGRALLTDYVFNDVLTTPLLSHQHGDSSGVRGAAQLWSLQELNHVS